MVRVRQQTPGGPVDYVFPHPVTPRILAAVEQRADLSIVEALADV